MPDRTDQREFIVDALKGFDGSPLAVAARRLFATLGYKSDRTLPINSLDDLQSALDTGHYLNEANAHVSWWKSVHFLFQLTTIEIASGTNAQLELGFAQPYEPKDVRSYVFFAVELRPRPDGKAPNRTELSVITRALNRLVPMPVLVLFKHSDAISIAIINRRRNLRDGTRDVLTRVSLIRGISLHEPHRAHIDLLWRFSLYSLQEESGSINTFNDLDNAWQKLLSVQELNRRFYRELVDWFNWAATEIHLGRLPDHTPDTPENRKRATQEFTVRLICRLLFAWFLKEMRLVPAKLLELYDAADHPRSLTLGTGERGFAKGNHYYRGILQNIFFKALNKPMNQRRKSAQEARQDSEVSKEELRKYAYVGKQNLPEDFDYSLFDRIPYLNGGLFDPLPEDNLEFTHEEGNNFRVPNRLFYARREDGHVTPAASGTRKGQRSVEGINRIFDRYRFTVTENTPLEEDVALDPELLGLVFENLLAEIDPTDPKAAESARKASGSYYTPRRIVDYMVNEALHLHLRTRFEQSGTSKTDLQLVSQLCYAPENVDLSPIAERVVSEIDAVRVLDPACGSGAFPMGMLHRMVELLRLVDPQNRRWKKRLLDRLPTEMRADAARAMEGKSYNYLRKLGLIQKNLYGLDIQPLAALIAKLRFFLTLVIEQEVQSDARANNYGLQALPNLETNLLCCNTLVDADHDMLGAPLLAQLRAAREEYYQPETTMGRRGELARSIGEKMASLYPGLAEEVKGIKPPTVDLKKGVTQQDVDRMRLQQDALLFAEWFQHATVPAPFFNVETFFPELIQHGKAADTSPFHIVIGNPPYGVDVQDSVRKPLGLSSNDSYGAFTARFLGAKPGPLAEGGVLAYIVSDTFMTIKTHRPLREQMLGHRIHKMIRVSGDTFRATVNCAVILCQRGSATDDHTCQMADLANVSIHDQYERFLHLLYRTEGFARRQSVSNQTYAIYHYRQSLIRTNSNIPFFVASPKFFALMNDTTAPVALEDIGGKRVPVRTVTLNGLRIQLIKLGDIAEVKVGLQTGDNDAYLFQNPVARGSYRSIESYGQCLLTEADLQRIRCNDTLRHEVIKHGISKDDSASRRYFGGRYIVPYDKGGESDSDEGWLPNYWVPTNYFIDWSENAVACLLNDGRIRASSRKPYPRNVETYFQSALTFSRTGVYAPTFRFNSSSPYDTEGSMLFFPRGLSLDNAIGLCASRLVKFQLKAFIGHTVHTQVDELKEASLIAVPLPGVEEQVREICRKQRAAPRYDYASNEQIEIDRLVFEAYGLNESDIREVEDWYARRYPKLAQAQRRSLAAKQGKTEEQLLARLVLHLYCDESRHLPHDREPFLLLGLLVCPGERARALNTELSSLWAQHGLPKHFEAKWTKVSPGRLDFYRVVLEWFLAAEGVAFRALALSEKQRLYAALPADTRDHLYYRLYYHLLRGVIEPENRYRVFLDLKDTRGREKIGHFREVLRMNADDPSGASVQTLQHVRSHEIRLLQVCDLLLGAIGFARRPSAKAESAAKRALVEFIEERLGQALTADSPPGADKFALMTWQDPDALLL